MEKGTSKILLVVGSIATLGIGLIIYLRNRSKSNINKSQGNVVTNIIQGAKEVVNNVTIGGLTHKRFPIDYNGAWYVFTKIFELKTENSFKSILPDLHRYKIGVDDFSCYDFILKEDDAIVTRICIRMNEQFFPKPENKENNGCFRVYGSAIYTYSIPKADKSKWNKIKDTEHGFMGLLIGFTQPYIYATELNNVDGVCEYKNFKSGVVTEIIAHKPFDVGDDFVELVPSANQEFSVLNFFVPQESGAINKPYKTSNQQVLLEYATKLKESINAMLNKLKEYDPNVGRASYFDGTQKSNSFDDIF